MEIQLTSWLTLAEQFPGLAPLARKEVRKELEFRPYQAAAVIQFLISGRGIIRSATGSGKTLIAAACCGALDKPALGLVHGRALVDQIYREFVKIYGPSCVGRITSSTFSPKKFTIASMDTVASHLKDKKKKERYSRIKDYLGKVELLFFDETHHASADSWQKIAAACSATHRLGLSGTPFRQEELSDMKLMAITGPLMCDIPTRKLQEYGYIAEAELIVKVGDYSTIKASATMDWQQAKKALIVKNKVRNWQIARDIENALKEPDTRLMVLTGNSVELGQNIAKELRDSGVKDWVFVSGQHSADEVIRAFEDLRAGRVRCVIVTKLADEGVDVPNINLLFLVGGGKSYVKAIQRVGRGLRKKEDDSFLTVVDYHVKGNRYMERHDRERLKHFEEESMFRDIRIEEL